MINCSGQLNKPSVFTISSSNDNKIISSRYSKVVDDFILSLDYLGTNPQTQKDVNRILRVLSEFLKEDFCITDFIKYDYVNLDPKIKKFFGGPGSLKRALDCNDLKTMELLIAKRVTYLMDKLNQKLIGALFTHHYKDDTYKQEFRASFGKLILALYSKGLRNFGSMALHGLDLSNQTFESCSFYGSAFYKSNLENSNFLKKCDLTWTSFGSTNTRYMSVSPDCLTEFVSFNSRLDLIKMDVPKTLKKLRLTKTVGLDEIAREELKFTSELLEDITGYLKSMPEEILKDEVFNKIYAENINIDETDKLEITSSQNRLPLFINRQCLILQSSVEIADLCGIRYGNNIQLYSIEALSKRLKLNKKCPLNMSLIYVRKNLYNLNDLKEEII